MQAGRAFDDFTRKLDDPSVGRRNARSALSGAERTGTSVAAAAIGAAAKVLAGGSNMEKLVLVLAIAMVALLPLEQFVGDYGRLAVAVLGFLLIFWWLFKNDQKKDLRGEL